MSTLTPAQKGAITRQRKKFLAELKAKQELYRNDHRALAAEIARRIRQDNHQGESPENYTNGTMHWYQQSWGAIKFDPSNLVKVTGKYGRPLVEVACPTTGCVAGWATTLAGYPMVFRNETLQELKDYYEKGDIVDVNDCHVNGEVQDIPATAADLLNIGTSKRMWLFDGYNSVQMVLWALDQIAEKGYFDPDHCPYDQDGDVREGFEEFPITKV